MPRSKVICTRLPKALALRLEAAAVESRVSRSAFCRAALLAALAEAEAEDEDEDGEGAGDAPTTDTTD